MKKVVAIIAVVLLTIVVTFAIVIYGYFNSFSGRNKQSGEGSIQPKEAKSGEPFNVLVLGVDIGTAGVENSPQRSDTMLVLHYDPGTSEMSMVSIPRDTQVILKGKPDKINAANAYGGTELAIASVEKLLDISINYYVEINYEGFREIVNAVGGIDVIIPYDMNYDDNVQDLHIHFKKGQNVHLDGQKAEEYVRWRKNNDGTGYAEGDLGRIKTQQEFIQKIFEKFKSASLSRKKSVIDILPEYISTNMGAGTMLNLAITELSKIDIGNIQKFTLQGESRTIDDISYFIYNPEKNRDILAKLGGGVPGADVGIDNKEIKIRVLNGSGMEGILAEVKKILEGKDYTLVSTGNITGVDFSSSFVIDKTLKGNNAKKVANELGISNIQKDQDNLSDADIVVILGKDRENGF